MKPYYYVYRPQASGPTVKHLTREAAKQEAERLAAKHPGVAFEILQCVGISQTSKANTFWMDQKEPQNKCIYEYLAIMPNVGWHWYREGTGPFQAMKHTDYPGSLTWRKVASP